MSIPAKGQKVMQDQDGIWLSAKLACQRTDLKRADLYRLARDGIFRHRGEDAKFNPAWFHEGDITAFVRTRLANVRNAPPKSPPKPRRKSTDAQIEAKHTREWKKAVERDRTIYARDLGRTGGRSGGAVSGVAAHLEGVMLYDIEQAKKKTRPKT